MILKIFCPYSLDESMHSQILWSYGLISPKTMLIFPENFLNFRFDMVEKQNIVNLSSYRSKSYASVVLSYSEVNFLGEGEDAVFCL